jgi:hypothetical protein
VAEKLIIAPLIFAIVVLGVFPKPVLDRITPSVNQLVIHVDRVTHTPIPSGLSTAPAPSRSRHGQVGAAALSPSPHAAVYVAASALGAGPDAPATPGGAK